jgi:hypothetical protein
MSKAFPLLLSDYGGGAGWPVGATMIAEARVGSIATTTACAAMSEPHQV